MTTEDFITDLFCRVDDRMKNVPNPSQASLWPSEPVTIGLLFALEGAGSRAFYRWLTRNYSACFPVLPERTRLFRRLKTHWQWAQLFLAQPSLLGVIDSYGIELIHPPSPQGLGGTGHFQPPLDRRRQVLPGPQPFRPNHRLGLGDRQCPRYVVPSDH